MEMTIDQFIKSYKLKPADAIRMKKKSFGMLDHYVLYLGVHNNYHKFVANYDKGVAIIPDSELIGLIQKLQPSGIEPFPGNERQRLFAIQRAFSRVGQQAYSLLANNCEHFKNFVHYGYDKSSQVEAFGGTVILTGLGATVAGIAQKNPVLTGVGLMAALLGGMIYDSETNLNKTGTI